MTIQTKVYKLMSAIQGIYTLLTSVWALVHIESFMKVTGPKNDIWLVKTVAVLLIPIGLSFLFARHVRRDHWIVVMVGITSCIGLACIDFYYTSNHTIRWIYSIDGMLQLVFLTGWIYFAIKQKKLRHNW